MSTSKRYTIQHLLSTVSVQDRVPFQLSPDGRFLAYSINGWSSAIGPPSSHTHKLMDGSHVQVMDTETGELTRPFPKTESWGGQWSPNGRTLAAYVSHDGRTHLGIWSRDEGTSTVFQHVLVRVQYGFEVPVWTPDGSSILIKLIPSRIKREVQQNEPSQSVRVFSHPAAKTQERSWNVENGLCDMGLVDIASARVNILVRNWAFRGWRVSPDGTSVGVLRLGRYEGDHCIIGHDLAVVSLNGTGARVVAKETAGGYHIGFSWSPDSRYIAYFAKTRSSLGRLFVVPKDGSTVPRDLSDGGHKDIRPRYEAPRWSEDSQWIYSISPNRIWSFSMDGNKRRESTLPEFSHIRIWIQTPMGNNLWKFTENSVLGVVEGETGSRLSMIHIETGQESPLLRLEESCISNTFNCEVSKDGSSIYLLLASQKCPSMIMQVNTPFHTPGLTVSQNSHLSEVNIGKVKRIGWSSPDGHPLHGALILPPDYVEGVRVPVIFQIYGGTHDSRLIGQYGLGNEFASGALWASRGLALFCPDMPLKGFGPFKQIPDLILPAMDRLIDIGIADSERFGVMGHSFGGSNTLALLTQTNRFKAAVCSAPEANLTSAYGILTDEGDPKWGYYEQIRIGRTLWEDREAYIENSPLFYMDKVETPVLLICGTADPGASSQAREAYSALKRLDKCVELREYIGEGHSPNDEWTTSNYQDATERILEWFATHLQIKERPGSV